MKLIVFGASGRVGKYFVEFALQAGHEVTAFVRTPEKMDGFDVTIAQGDALNAQDVLNAIPGHDAVISCLGSSTGMKKGTTLEEMGKNIADAMAQKQITRLVYCASAGIDGEIPGLTGKMVMKMLANPLKDHRNALNYYKTKNITYTIARPMGLKDQDFNPNYEESFEGVPTSSSSIPRASVAHFMVKALTDSKYENASVGLCG